MEGSGSGLEGFLVEGSGTGSAKAGWLKVDGAVRWLTAGDGRVDLYEPQARGGREGRAGPGPGPGPGPGVGAGARAEELKLVYSFEAEWVKRIVTERSREKPAFVVSWGHRPNGPARPAAPSSPPPPSPPPIAPSAAPPVRHNRVPVKTPGL